MMKIDEAEVRQTAALARLALSDEEVARMTRELDAILAYMEKLSSVDVTDVPPMTHAVATALPLRDDDLGAHLPVERALASAPRHQEGLFEVPRVIAHDKEAG